MHDRTQIYKANNFIKALKNFRMVMFTKENGSAIGATAMGFKSLEVGSDTKVCSSRTNGMDRVHSSTVMAVYTRVAGSQTSAMGLAF